MLSLKKAGQIIHIKQIIIVRATVLNLGSCKAIPGNHIKYILEPLRSLLGNLC